MGNEEDIRPVGARGGLISSGGEALCLQGWQGSMAMWMGCIVRFTCCRGVRQPVSVLQLGWLVWVAVGVVFVWGGCTRLECGTGGMVWLLMQSGCMEGLSTSRWTYGDGCMLYGLASDALIGIKGLSTTRWTYVDLGGGCN